MVITNHLDNAMNIKYVVALNEDEKISLTQLLSKGKASARMLKRANILLMSDKRKYKDKEISAVLNVSTSTIYRTKKRFVEEGLVEALNEGARQGMPRKLDANQEALLISLACTKPPKGCARWTLSLIAEKFILLSDVEPVSVETIRRRFKENDLKPWQKKMWCVGKMNADYVAQMEHILDLYAQPKNVKQPIVNFDEAMKQLVSDITSPSQTKRGQVARMDYEYKRVSVANIFMFFDRHRGWRKAKATSTKKANDFAQCMKELVDEHYPEAEKIHVVMDNYGTHKAGSLYKAFKPEEALRILNRLEFHYTPKHASWLNMVEIEIGNMNQQCLDRRIPSWDELKSELEAWEKRKNNAGDTINWMFNVDSARKKLTRAYEALNQS